MIGYYIHHQGSGHLARAQAISRHLSTPVVALTSCETVATGFAEVITLDRDDDPNPATDDDVTAGGVLHWVPRRHSGLRGRMAQIARFVETHSPAAIVVDVSVEVALFVRLLGVPVIVVAMPGRRTDAAHQLAYRVADAIIAPWPASLYQPAWLADHLHKTTFTGGISRFDGRTATPDPDLSCDLLVLTGTGGDPTAGLPMTGTARTGVAMTADDDAGLTVIGLGPAFGTWVADPWPYLCSARVVAINAGQGSVADVAVAQRPAVVLPDPRPFAEQETTADTLASAGLARVVGRWPSTLQWQNTIRAAPVTASRWARWHTAGAAPRAAGAIEAAINR